MKTKQRWLTLLVCSCMLATLVGCGGSPKSGGDDSSVSSSSSSGDTSTPDSSELSNLGSNAESSDTSDVSSDAGTTNSNSNTSSGSKPNSNTSSNSPVSSNAPSNNSGSPSSGSSKTLPVKNMGGRTFTFCAPSWEIIDLEESWVKALQSKYNCKFKNLQLADYSTLYSSILAGDPLADVITMGDSNFYQYVQKKLLRSLSASQYIDVDDSSLYVTGLNDIFTVSGKAYGVSRDGYAVRRLLAYNKSLITGSNDLQTLADAGKLTWDKLYEILTKVSKSGVAGIAGQMYECDVLEAFIVANGGRIFKRDSGLNFTYTLDSQNTRNAISFVQKLYSSGCIMPMNGGNYLYPQSQFAKGKVAMMLVDGWNLGDIYKKAKFDVGIVMLPAGGNASSPLVEQTVYECYSIPATVENPEDVELIFAAWVKAADANGEGKNYFLDEWKDVMDDPKNLKVLEKYISIVDSGKAVVDYKNTVTNFYNDGLYDYQQKALFGELSAQSYLEAVGTVYKSKAADFGS